MSEFVQGQRWLADGEPELGLGMVQSFDERTVTLFFPASETERCYALKQAPLTRVRFEAGETISRRDKGKADVKAVHELNGLLVYEVATGDMVPETELGDTLARNNPLTRLMTGQTDHPSWFAFRSRLNAGYQAIWNAHLNGLLGTRSTLLPHQLYVAQQATERTRVRALLSDEVGLGKTLEAGLIINRLRQQGRISRVLIAVPDALAAQWLVELVRRFSIHAELYQSDEHDFALGQVHLIPHSLLNDPEEMAWVTPQDWDMLVIDEAHHLTLNDSEFDKTTSWLALAKSTAHLLLLTATPEQLGHQAHFERLQLLDASRFVSFEQFQADEQHFRALSELARQLHEEAPIAPLQPTLKDLGIEWHQDYRRALNEVLDRHGTGRTVYRNTRRGINGFYPRVAHAYPAVNDDARRAWLVDWLKADRSRKTLLITQSAETAQELAHFLWHGNGIEATAFHEGLNLIERDRAAAHFADSTEAAQILVCSEIGGEGRNFQFCHHLVLWDIPQHPDVLEQRIGRLDRIGQTETISVHLPYINGTEDALRYRWYHELLGCIEQLQPAAGAVHEQFAEQWLQQPEDPELEARVKSDMARLNEELEQGRDVMLELNSCRQPDADDLKRRIEAFEEATAESVVEQAADLLNLHFEAISEGVWELIPSDNMMIPVIPGIPEGGALVTFDRQTALKREDVLFVSWEHPLILGLLDVLSSSELGQASVALLETEQVPAGQLLLEMHWQVSIPERVAHALKPWVNTSLIRTLMLEGGTTDLSRALPEASLEPQIRTLPKKTVRQLVQSAKARLNAIYESSLGYAQERFEAEIAQAREALNDSHEARIERTRYLAGINPMVTDRDISKAEMLAEMHDSAWQDVELVPVGVRMILCAPPGTL
ncbi:MAG: helicase-related protein [Saccharospirillum sp.]